MKHAKQYFDNHPSVDVLYFTADNLAFFEHRNAVNQAAALDDETITEISRKEAECAMEDMGEEEYEDMAYLDEPDAE